MYFNCLQPTTELQEQLRRLESDKESLSLQVAVLTDQVDAQSEKINDLEKALSEQKRQLTASEDLLQRVSNIFVLIKSLCLLTVEIILNH